MGKENFFVKTLLKLGEGNNAALVSSSIALAKGIFRPIFTMSDKKEKPETKKYTAIREGLTELIAIPIYLTSGKIAEKIIKKYENVEHYMDRARTLLVQENPSQKISDVEIAKKAEELKASLHPKIKAVLPFVGVGLSALVIIPAICSAVIKPIMQAIQKPSSQNDAGFKTNPADPLMNSNTGLKARNFIYNDNYHAMSAFNTNYKRGMKVGGV